MIKKGILILLLMSSGIYTFSQYTGTDSTQSKARDQQYLDSSINYDELFQDFDYFMDSILTPHSYFMANLSLSNGYYNFDSKTNNTVEASKRVIY